MLQTRWSAARELHGVRECAKPCGVILLADLDAFLQEHRRCGDLDAAVEGDRVWMTSSCGAVLVRVVAFG
jgi:hypothetical protein